MKRRAFLTKTALGAAAFTILPRHVLGGKGYIAPNDKINIGFIGTGKQSIGLMRGLGALKETNLIAAADVDRIKLCHFKEQAQQVLKEKSVNTALQTFKHYRELLELKTIDAVVIASPDHWHAMHTVDAAKAGKDIYCEKPLALTIHEGRAMVEAVRKYKRVLQTGSMQRSYYHFRQAVDLIRNGHIGQIREINVSIGEPVRACDLPSLPAPHYLDWDLWVGPSMYRGYNPTLSPPIESDEWALWRLYKDFGGGYITDWGAHMFDIVQWALDQDHSGPVEFVPPSVPHAKEGLYYTYANGIRVNHKSWGTFNAIQFIGSEGNLEVARGMLKTSNAQLQDYKFNAQAKRVQHVDNHFQNWVDCIKTRQKPICDVEIGHRTSSVCNAVNIAYELQKPLKWDPKQEAFNDVSANIMRGRPYRGPWNYLDF